MTLKYERPKKRYQPRTPGVRRIPKVSCLHEEVMLNLQEIADTEDKSFSWVVAEIIYAYFGLKIDEKTVKVLRRLRRFKRFSSYKNVIKFKKVS